MLQEYWASTVIFIGIFSQCTSRTTAYSFSMRAREKNSFNIEFSTRRGWFFFCSIWECSYNSLSKVSRQKNEEQLTFTLCKDNFSTYH